MTFVLLSTHGDAHHVVVLHQGVEETVLQFNMTGDELLNERTWRPTGKLADWRSEQNRAQRTAEGLAELYRASLIVS